VLDNAVLHWLGRRSYGLYLFHLMILFQLVGQAPDIALYKRTSLYLAALGLPLALLAAELSWRLVERPALRLKVGGRVAAPKPTVSSPAAPTAAPPAA
jgi:peptidoglycan/LPS O-acetylase OafA/YrhL